MIKSFEDKLFLFAILLGTLFWAALLSLTIYGICRLVFG